MNGNTDEPRWVDADAWARLIGEASSPTRFAEGGVIMPGTTAAGNDRLGFDVDVAGAAVLVRPIEDGFWEIIVPEGLMRPVDEPSDEAPTVSIEDRIDRAIAGLCPCGAARREPSEELPAGSPYCGYDCEPNHTSAHTDLREQGWLATPSRWRPDLVSAADENAMTGLTTRKRVAGRWRQVWRHDDGGIVQLRLDDDYRYVGCDMPHDVWLAGGAEVDRRWAALEHELAADLDEEARNQNAITGMQQLLRARERAHQAQMAAMRSLTRVETSPGHIWAFDWGFDGEATRRGLAGLSAIAAPIRRLFENVGAAGRAMTRTLAAATDPVENPRERALRLRRERNTGPAQQQRAPRRIDARGSR